MFDLLVSIFGKGASPTKKYLRMMYWLPKLKHVSPWPAPQTRTKDQKEAAVLAVKRMGSVDLESDVTVFYVSFTHFLSWLFFSNCSNFIYTLQTKDDNLSTEDTWIVSSQSPVQKNLVKYHPENLPMYIDGPHRMHLGRKNVVDYYVLKADMPENRRRRKFRDPDGKFHLMFQFKNYNSTKRIATKFNKLRRFFKLTLSRKLVLSLQSKCYR